MIDINYELYKVFYHVASTLNFSEASKQLYISQSAVSQMNERKKRKPAPLKEPVHKTITPILIRRETTEKEDEPKNR